MIALSPKQAAKLALFRRTAKDEITVHEGAAEDGTPWIAVVNETTGETLAHWTVDPVAKAILAADWDPERRAA